MNKIKRRALIILALVAFLALGSAYFLIILETDGEDWAAFASNTHTHTNGILTSGQVRDRNGVLLLSTDEEGNRVYSDDYSIRMATLHAVGDPAGNIGGSATSIFERQLMGYNMVNGVYSFSGKGRDVYLTIDAELNKVAWNALGGRQGCVAVMDYTTGDLVVMVSSPGFEPNSPPDNVSYLNRFLSGVYPPGSTFKILTAQAALENIENLDTFSYTCTGSAEYEDGTITCQYAHGELTFYDALAVSCNCCFAALAQQLTGETLAEYADKAGLTEADFDVNGYTPATGSFDIAAVGSMNLGWSGVGQYHDLVNPCSMLRYISAIANGGKAVEPTLLAKVTSTGGIPLWFDLFHNKDRIMKSDIANELKEMMAYCVRENYGVESFPGLPVCAKSGTAEVESGAAPHAWFTGFLNSEEHPYAFIVLVENGGAGSSVAGSVANTVLQAVVAADE